MKNFEGLSPSFREYLDRGYTEHAQLVDALVSDETLMRKYIAASTDMDQAMAEDEMLEFHVHESRDPRALKWFDVLDEVFGKILALSPSSKEMDQKIVETVLGHIWTGRYDPRGRVWTGRPLAKR